MGKVIEQRVLCLGDVHAEWVHKESITKVLEFAEYFKPTHIVQLGDLYDLYSFSTHPKSINLRTPQIELLNARVCAEEIWRMLRKKAPKAECHQIMGNHDMRIQKRVMEKANELESLINTKPLWEFEGVKTVFDYREELILEINGDPIVFMHGFRSKLGDHAKYNQLSTVCGHTHRAGVAYIPIYDPRAKKNKVLFELNCGHLSDESSKVMGYTTQKISNWTRGVGAINGQGPRFISFG